MTCPYCSTHMQQCATMAYRGSTGVRVITWVRCPACQHVTLQPTSPVFPTGQQMLVPSAS